MIRCGGRRIARQTKPKVLLTGFRHVIPGLRGFVLAHVSTTLGLAVVFQFGCMGTWLDVFAHTTR